MFIDEIKINNKYWPVIILAVPSLFINENVVQWALAVVVGRYTVVDGFKDAFEHFTIIGYIFSTAFRSIPYVLLGLVLNRISQTKLKDYFWPTFLGGLIGILTFIIWGLWMAMHPYYTDEHVSSTTAIAFVFIPMYALIPGAIVAFFFSGVYAPIRYLLTRKKDITNPST